jgi:hypothetical protein
MANLFLDGVCILGAKRVVVEISSMSATLLDLEATACTQNLSSPADITLCGPFSASLTVAITLEYYVHNLRIATHSKLS